MGMNTFVKHTAKMKSLIIIQAGEPIPIVSGWGAPGVTKKKTFIYQHVELCILGMHLHTCVSLKYNFLHHFVLF